VISIGAPFRGSFEAVLKVATGLAELGQESQSASERDAARMTPSLYHLLPDFPGALDVPLGMPETLFDPRLWQPAVVESIAMHMREFGRDGPDTAGRARALFGSLLEEARAHRERISALSLPEAGLSESDWLCIVGVDARTRVHLRVRTREGDPEFDLESGDRRNEFLDADVASRAQTGDGTVPYPGALPPFLGKNRIVCVTPDDFGYWELGDRSLRRLSGFHGILPKMNLIHRLSAAFLTGVARRGLWGRPAPDMADPEEWDPPVPGIEGKLPEALEISRT
jgi:hypothetical protein